jgi:hypothetical protein
MVEHQATAQFIDDRDPDNPPTFTIKPVKPSQRSHFKNFVYLLKCLLDNAAGAEGSDVRY